MAYYVLLLIIQLRQQWYISNKYFQSFTELSLEQLLHWSFSRFFYTKGLNLYGSNAYQKNNLFFKNLYFIWAFSTFDALFLRVQNLQKALWMAYTDSVQAT